MDKMRCECCGGTLKRIDSRQYRCEYCGTMFKNSSEDMVQPVYVQMCQSPTKVLKSKMVVDREVLNAFGEQQASEYAIHNLSRNLAEALAPMMKIETEYDPCGMRQIVTASVRVVEPDYRF